ncbi:NADH dehydrogenase domain protein [Acinetobacter baumannii OIFC180]|nr:NADH dehydrogenase domain protein [Acinetobacter baumannii OIFC180]
MVEVELENGAKLESKTVILSTGARWREMNVPVKLNTVPVV